MALYTTVYYWACIGGWVVYRVFFSFKVIRQVIPPGLIWQWFFTTCPWVSLPGPKGLLRVMKPVRPVARFVVSCCRPFAFHPLAMLEELATFEFAQTGATLSYRTDVEETSAKHVCPLPWFLEDWSKFNYWEGSNFSVFLNGLFPLLNVKFWKTS